MNKLEIYTDGGCVLEKRIGGWGIVVVENGNLIDENSDIEASSSTTNNTCELIGFIKALEYANGRECTIISDSRYVIDGYNDWMHNWAKYSWSRKRLKYREVKNEDLWRQIYSLYSGSITAKWVRGHSGNEFNELADMLASKYLEFIDEEPTIDLYGYSFINFDEINTFQDLTNVKIL